MNTGFFYSSLGGRNNAFDYTVYSPNLYCFAKKTDQIDFTYSCSFCAGF